jgi:hypothetical protein
MKKVLKDENRAEKRIALVVSLIACSVAVVGFIWAVKPLFTEGNAEQTIKGIHQTGLNILRYKYQTYKEIQISSETPSCKESELGVRFFAKLVNSQTIKADLCWIPNNPIFATSGKDTPQYHRVFEI